MTGEAWRQYLQTYVALRRATGFSMQREERLLHDFGEHLERHGHNARLHRSPSSGPRRAPKVSTRGG